MFILFTSRDIEASRAASRRLPLIELQAFQYILERVVLRDLAFLCAYVVFCQWFPLPAPLYVGLKTRIRPDPLAKPE